MSNKIALNAANDLATALRSACGDKNLREYRAAVGRMATIFRELRERRRIAEAEVANLRCSEEHFNKVKEQLEAAFLAATRRVVEDFTLAMSLVKGVPKQFQEASKEVAFAGVVSFLTAVQEVFVFNEKTAAKQRSILDPIPGMEAINRPYPEFSAASTLREVAASSAVRAPSATQAQLAGIEERIAARYITATEPAATPPPAQEPRSEDLRSAWAVTDADIAAERTARRRMPELQPRRDVAPASTANAYARARDAGRRGVESGYGGEHRAPVLGPADFGRQGFGQARLDHHRYDAPLPHEAHQQHYPPHAAGYAHAHYPPHEGHYAAAPPLAPPQHYAPPHAPGAHFAPPGPYGGPAHFPAPPTPYGVAVPPGPHGYEGGPPVHAAYPPPHQGYAPRPAAYQGGPGGYPAPGTGYQAAPGGVGAPAPPQGAAW